MKPTHTRNPFANYKFTPSLSGGGVLRFAEIEAAPLVIPGAWDMPEWLNDSLARGAYVKANNSYFIPPAPAIKCPPNSPVSKPQLGVTQ